MQKFKALLRSWSGNSIDPTDPFVLTDTFRALPSSVSGAAGALNRYVSGLMLTAKAVLTFEGQGEAPNIWANWLEIYDAMLGRISWTRYGGQFVPQALRASELLAILYGHGCIPPGKEPIIFWTSGWDGNKANVYASILIPTTPTMFSTAHTKAATDAPWPSALLGASSAYTIQGGVGSLPDFVTCEDDLRIEASALCFDTEDFYVARPIEYRKYLTDDDPAILPSPFCKMPMILACNENWDSKTFAPFLSDIAVPIVRVDGRQLQERMNARIFQYADAWYRDDAYRLTTLPGQFGVYLNQLIMILRNPFETDKVIEQPAGSKWTVEGIGMAMSGGQNLRADFAASKNVRYLYSMLYEPDPALVSYQCSQMGVDPSAVRMSNLSINSNGRAGISMTQEEAVGIPTRLGATRYE